MRQVLMERFNADPRIFCFILSTRSGGVGVNLTGADTVIFYDSDWNPTMDAQAQDRCHRIGQTRDVHIYRLISERTVEENILKKANQKRMLGDIAIEGGNFNPTFKKQTIHDLFEVDAEEADASKRMAEVLDRPKDDSRSADEVGSAEENLSVVQSVSKQALGVLESALAAAEDETDVAAARVVRAEVAAEMAEFDESAPINAADDRDNADADPDASRTEAEHEQKLRQLEGSLSPVERYALKFMENSEACWSAEQLKAAEAQIEEQKKQWELRRVASLTGVDDERNNGLETLSNCADAEAVALLTYSHQDSVNQVKKKSGRSRTQSNLSQSQSSSSFQSQPDGSVSSQRTERKTKKRHSVALVANNSHSLPCTDSSKESKDSNDASEVVNRSPTPGREQRKRTRNSATREQQRDGSVTPEVPLDGSSPPVSATNAHSPRTRSRGTVNINLWTLDRHPLLPGAKISPCPTKTLSTNKAKVGLAPATTPNPNPNPHPNLNPSVAAHSVDGNLSNGCDPENVPVKKVKLIATAAAADLETESDLDVVS